MDTEQVVQALKDQNWDILSPPGRIPEEAAGAILPFLDDADGAVRELAVCCLDEAGGPQAKQGLLKALHDDSGAARSRAGQYLHKFVDAGDLPVLQRELESNRDEFVREQVALMIGRLGDAETIAVLRARAGGEQDEHARHALSLAMARLGDAREVEAYTTRLEAEAAETRASALQDFEYLQDRRYLPHILPLLDDVRDVVPLRRGNVLHYLRVCDVAINAADKALDPPFAFEVGPPTRYSDDQRAQAKAVLADIQETATDDVGGAPAEEPPD